MAVCLFCLIGLKTFSTDLSALSTHVEDSAGRCASEFVVLLYPVGYKPM